MSVKSEAAASAPAVTEGALIRSPTIGTFYSSSKPGAPAFVKVGDVVSPDTIVCLVEAMKMFNEIPAGVSGKIAEVLVKDGEPVDNNKPLFRVIPA
jgi:acetyl-CoA carboxylase biotin carboxyl carrier protein